MKEPQSRTRWLRPWLTKPRGATTSRRFYGGGVEVVRRWGSAASSVESVRLDPEFKRDLLLRAARERISVSEAIRRAIGQYLLAG